jgi:hypothetical protein
MHCSNLMQLTNISNKGNCGGIGYRWELSDFCSIRVIGDEVFR